MDPARLSADGAQMLCPLPRLRRVRGNRPRRRRVKDKPALNPFEVDVADQLTAAGIPLDCPVRRARATGSTSPPSTQPEPGRMVLAIEADGAIVPLLGHGPGPRPPTPGAPRAPRLDASTGSGPRSGSTTARRRSPVPLEAYRKAVEWADDPHCIRTNSSEASGATAIDLTPTSTLPTAPQRVGPQPVHGGYGNIKFYKPADLVALIRWIQSDTLLRTEDELIDEAMRCLGFKKRGPRIVESLSAAIERAQQPDSPPALPPQPPKGTTSYRPRSTGRRPRRGW